MALDVGGRGGVGGFGAGELGGNEAVTLVAELMFFEEAVPEHAGADAGGIAQQTAASSCRVNSAKASWRGSSGGRKVSLRCKMGGLRRER
ncbi:MAG: hypothetical protein RL077_542 [Verrucomicrobiota bacterium]